MSDELLALSADEQARLVRQRAVSPVELVEASLRRIERVQPQLNCFAFVYAEAALEAARAAEAALVAGEPVGALHGVPVAFKDFTPMKGRRTTLGSYCYENWVPDFDPVIVRRFAAAGAIVVGKTTTPEFAYSSFTRSPLWGVTRNPWNPACTPGGSSGGAAAAVATEAVALAEGTDMGGSVRIPAALSGVVGLKPSFGRIPMDILDTTFDSISHFGPLARTVGDAALFLRVAEGPDEADIQSQRSPLALPDTIPADVVGLRIALSSDLGFFRVDPEVAANLDAVARVLEEAGAIVEPVALDWTSEIVTAWLDIWAVVLAAAFGHCLEAHRARMDPDVVALIEHGQAMDAVRYRRLEFVRTRQWRSLAALFQGFDALLCPTMAVPAPLAEGRDADFEGFDENGKLIGLDMTSPFNNVPQCPALSVPSGWTAAGLPTGAQIVTRRFDDPMALRIGRAVEVFRPWAGRRPPLPGI